MTVLKKFSNLYSDKQKTTHRAKMRREGYRIRMNPVKEINSCFHTSVLLVFKIDGFSD